jgi:hypothetical protein
VTQGVCFRPLGVSNLPHEVVSNGNVRLTLQPVVSQGLGERIILICESNSNLVFHMADSESIGIEAGVRFKD